MGWTQFVRIFLSVNSYDVIFPILSTCPIVNGIHVCCKKLKGIVENFMTRDLNRHP